MAAAPVVQSGQLRGVPGAEATALPTPKGAPKQIPTISARQMFDNERYRGLDKKQRYFDGKQHDHKSFDFNGRVISQGSDGMGIVSMERMAAYIPLSERRPSTPYRLPRAIVSRFTDLLFGEHRFPQMRVEGDSKTQDFAQALVRATSLPTKMIRARNLGGSTGSVALSWSYIDGKPNISVHNAKNIFVHAWTDRDALVPEYVTEAYRFFKDEVDPETRKYQRNWYWYRRDWTPDEDILYLPTRFRAGEEPVFQVDKAAKHGDGINHVTWVQNLPTEEIDGESDYEAQFDSFDSLDVLLSVVFRGAILNLDPTLVIKMDPEFVNRMGITKGSDNALVVGKDGDASYMEMGGTSITSGVELLNAVRQYILEACSCVIPDPNEIASQGVSSVTLRALYAPMLGKSDTHREQYGTAITNVLGQMCAVARQKYGEPATVTDEDGNETEGKFAIELPPLVKRVQPIDPDTGEEDPLAEPDIEVTEREPGEGGEIEARWGPYFLPTPDDQSKTSATLSTSTGGKPFLSAETAIEICASMYGLEGDEEKRRLARMAAADAADRAAMFADSNGTMGGRVPGGPPGPPGGPPKPFGGPKPPGVPKSATPAADKVLASRVGPKGETTVKPSGQAPRSGPSSLGG